MYPITHNGKTLAILIPGSYRQHGVHFVTPNNYSQQLGYMHHMPGHVIKAHRHLVVPREVEKTLEVLFIRRGKLRVDFYTSAGAYIESYILCEGDTILLVSGGHGFEVLEETEMIEVKQGPYAGDEDKALLDPIDPRQLVVKSYAPNTHQYPAV